MTGYGAGPLLPVLGSKRGAVRVPRLCTGGRIWTDLSGSRRRAGILCFRGLGGQPRATVVVSRGPVSKVRFLCTSATCSLARAHPVSTTPAHRGARAQGRCLARTDGRAWSSSGRCSRTGCRAGPRAPVVTPGPQVRMRPAWVPRRPPLWPWTRGVLRGTPRRARWSRLRCC